jgi:hypothetical protein
MIRGYDIAGIYIMTGVKKTNYVSCAGMALTGGPALSILDTPGLLM